MLSTLDSGMFKQECILNQQLIECKKGCAYSLGSHAYLTFWMCQMIIWYIIDVVKPTLFYMSRFCMHYMEKYTIKLPYILSPFCQKSAPNIKEDAAVIANRPRLYLGFLQQDRCRFQRHALNCSHPFCGKRVGKSNAFVPCAGKLSSLTRSLFFLY